MTQRRTALSRAARARASWITVAIVAVAAGPACKPSSTKITMGPFTGDRYESTAPDGSALSCFVFAGETSRPVRLCGDGGPIAGYAGVQFEAVAPAPDAKFISAIGQPLDPGTWILRSTGGTSVDAWGL